MQKANLCWLACKPLSKSSFKLANLDRVLTIVPTASEGYDFLVMEMTESQLGDESES